MEQEEVFIAPGHGELFGGSMWLSYLGVHPKRMVVSNNYGVSA